MSFLRRFVATVLVGASLVACSGEQVTGATDVALTDTQRSALAQQLVGATASSGEGSIAAALAAAAIVGGAEIRAVTASQGGLAALVAQGSRAAAPDGARGSLALPTPSAAGYSAVAVQLTESGSPDVTSVIVAWRQDADGTPTDIVLTLAAGAGPAGFAAADQGAPAAFGLVYRAPASVWVAAEGSTSLRRTSTGDRCRDIDQRLAAAGLRGGCTLARFAGGIEIAASAPTAQPGNAAQGSASVSIPEAPLGGVVIDVTGPAASRLLSRVRR